MYLPHTATIRRLAPSGNKYLFGDVGSTECFKQPIDETSAQLYGMTMSKGFVVYLPSTATVKESDELVIGSVKYGVRGVSSRDYGNLQHKKAIVELL